MSTTPTFTLTLRVADGDIDPQGHVNNVAFVRYVQEAAVAHWQAVASPELQAAFTWVVRRHEVEYLRPGMPGDELVVRTGVGEPSGATWERFTEIRRADGGDRSIVMARTGVGASGCREQAATASRCGSGDSVRRARLACCRVKWGRPSSTSRCTSSTAMWPVGHIRIRGGTAPSVIG